MPKQKVAVIGVFNIGKKHVDAWSRTEGAELVAIADLNTELGEKVQREYHIPQLYSDYTEMLRASDADIVSVCLPTGLHERVVTDCLLAGRHVLCEKPPSTSAAAARNMHESAVKAGKQLGYSLQRRFSKPVQASRQAVMNGAIGEVLYGKTAWTRHAPMNFRNTMWRFDQHSGGGSLLDLGVHLLDAAWYALGCPRPVSASGRVSAAQVAEYCQRKGQPVPEQPADDTAVAWIRFAGGAVLTLESSFGMWTLEEEVRCDLHGTDGAVRMYPGPAAIVDRNGKQELEEPTVIQEHLGVTHDFVSAVEEGRRPCVDGEQGIALHQMLDAIVQSAAEGREIYINEREWT